MIAVHPVSDPLLATFPLAACPSPRASAPSPGRINLAAPQKGKDLHMLRRSKFLAIAASAALAAMVGLAPASTARAEDAAAAPAPVPAPPANTLSLNGD